MAASASLSVEPVNLPNYQNIPEPPVNSPHPLAGLAIEDTGLRNREKLGAERRCAIALKTWFSSLK